MAAVNDFYVLESGFDTLSVINRTWNPGWYMALPRPGFGLLGAHQQARFDIYDEIGSETSIQGVQIYVYWKDVETAQGDYSVGIQRIRDELAYLQALPVPKRLWIRLDDRPPSGGSWTVGFPSFYGPEQAVYSYVGEGNNTNFRRWVQVNADRWNAMMTALGDALNDEPYLEGISINKESSVGNSSSGIALDDAYSSAKHWAALKTAALAAKAAFPNKNVSMNVVDIPYNGSSSQVSDQILWCAANGIGVGGPDVRPECVGNDGINGDFVSPPGQKPDAHNYLFGNAYLGQIPITYSVESSELGNAAVGEASGYTSAKLFDFITNQIGGTHVFWARRSFTYNPANGTPTQQASYQHLWDDQVSPSNNQYADEFDLPFIQANPWPASNRHIPSTYL